jgi:hypothetical protein
VLQSEHYFLSSLTELRLEWRGQDGQSETEQPDHSASLGDSIRSSTRIRFSVHTGTKDKEHAMAEALKNSIAFVGIGIGKKYRGAANV